MNLTRRMVGKAVFKMASKTASNDPETTRQHHGMLKHKELRAEQERDRISRRHERLKRKRQAKGA
jgi:hypothetical protein